MAQQAQPEPTMEEILASIRRIISEDAEDSSKRPAAEPAQEPARKEATDEEEVLELTEVVEEERPQSQEPKAKVMASEPAPVREPQPAPRMKAPEPPAQSVVEEEEDVMLVDRERESGDEALLSSAATNAMSSAFAQLAERTRVAGDSGVTLEDMVRQMIKPLLKEWLDAHLPPLVERLVQEEIERAARQPARRR